MTTMEEKQRQLEIAVAIQQQRMTQFEQVVLQLADTNRQINESLQRMVGLEIRHNDTRENIDALAELVRIHELRISEIEQSKQFWTMSSQALWAGLLLMAIGGFTYMWQQSNRQSIALSEYRENILHPDKAFKK